MKTIVCLCITILLGFLLLGCTNKCCDCDEIKIDEQGNFSLIRNWDNLWNGMIRPKELDVYFYSQHQDLEYLRVSEDTTRLFLEEGEYTVLAVNDSKYISGIGTLGRAKISLPCSRDNNKLIVSEAPMTIVDFSTSFVDNRELSECIVSPSPIVYIINFRFIIETDFFIGEIKECTAELNNVTTSKMLSGETDPENIPAILSFTVSETAKGIFDKKVHILGLSDYGNVLDISVVCENETKRVGVDLTNLFDFSISPIQNCVIQLHLNTNLITAVVEDISIENWYQGEDDNIEFKNK